MPVTASPWGGRSGRLTVENAAEARAQHGCANATIVRARRSCCFWCLARTPVVSLCCFWCLARTPVMLCRRPRPSRLPSETPGEPRLPSETPGAPQRNARGAQRNARGAQRNARATTESREMHSLLPPRLVPRLLPTRNPPAPLVAAAGTAAALGGALLLLAPRIMPRVLSLSGGHAAGFPSLGALRVWVVDV